MAVVLGTLLVWTVAGAAFAFLFQLFGLRFAPRDETPEAQAVLALGPGAARWVTPAHVPVPRGPIGLSVAALASLGAFQETSGQAR